MKKSRKLAWVVMTPSLTWGRVGKSTYHFLVDLTTGSLRTAAICSPESAGSDPAITPSRWPAGAFVSYKTSSPRCAVPCPRATVLEKLAIGAVQSKSIARRLAPLPL